MPKDYGYNPFNIEVARGRIDVLGDDYLDTFKDGDLADEFETQFIDEFYGTDDAEWDDVDVGDNAPTLKDIPKTEANALIGLDLHRVAPKENLSKQDHYEHSTRGRVNWAKYYDDNAYKEAWETIKKSKDKKYDYADRGGGLKDFLTDSSMDPKRKISNWTKVQFVRDAGKLGTSASTEDWLKEPTDWDGKYEPSFDAENPPKYTPSTLDVSTRADGTPYKPADIVKPLKARREVVWPNIKVRPARVSVPINLPKGKAAHTGKAS